MAGEAPPPLRLHPRRSLRLLVWMGIPALAAILTVAALPLQFWQRSALWLLVGGVLIHELRLHYLRYGPRAVVEAAWSVEKGWSITTANGVTHATALLPGGLSHPALIVLRFEAGGWRCYGLVLPADSLDRETARRLRRLLKSLSPRRKGNLQSTASGGT